MQDHLLRERCLSLRQKGPSRPANAHCMPSNLSLLLCVPVCACVCVCARAYFCGWQCGELNPESKKRRKKGASVAYC